MGLYDRDYYQERSGSPGFQPRSMAFALVLINVGVWVVLVALMRSFQLKEWLGCTPGDLFGRLRLWQPFTAAFVHDPGELLPIITNMLFLYVFGREVEASHGPRRLLALYLTAGPAAILAEAVLAYAGGSSDALIFGSSGAVLAAALFFTSLHLKQEITVVSLVSIPAWILCAILVFTDLYTATAEVRPGNTRLAFLGHLVGGGVGLLHRLPLRQRGDAPAPPPRRAASAPAPQAAGPPPPPRRDPVSERIDQILEKISRSGRESLTPEELEYLQRNSGRYRSK